MENVKDILADNLAKLRIRNNLTQADVAKKLNYSDKSVSKWEQGLTTPPIDVLKDIANMYGVSVDYLLTENTIEELDKRYNVKENTTNKIIITSLAVVFVWLIALVVFFYRVLIHYDNPWISFIFAIPLSFIFLLVFNCIWGKRKYIFIIVSCVIWSLLTYFFVKFITLGLWMIYLLGIPLQIGTILWSQLKLTKK